MKVVLLILITASSVLCRHRAHVPKHKQSLEEGNFSCGNTLSTYTFPTAKKCDVYDGSTGGMVKGKHIYSNQPAYSTECCACYTTTTGVCLKGFQAGNPLGHTPFELVSCTASGTTACCASSAGACASLNFTPQFSFLTTKHLDVDTPKAQVAPTTGTALRLKDLPDYNQCSSTWACHPYAGTIGNCATSTCKNKDLGTKNTNNICSSGCGLTSSAMILSWYKKDSSITPVYAADWFKGKGYRNSPGGPSPATCSGVTHQAISEFFRAHGMEVTSRIIPTVQDVNDALAFGGPVIAHMKAKSGVDCKFTSGGHYIVLVSVSAGVYTIHDPGSSSSSRDTGTEAELFEGCQLYGVLRPHCKGQGATPVHCV